MSKVHDYHMRPFLHPSANMETSEKIRANYQTRARRLKCFRKRNNSQSHLGSKNNQTQTTTHNKHALHLYVQT